MEKQNNKVWVGISDRSNDPELVQMAQQEFVELPIIDTLSKDDSVELKSNRRDFLKYLGFGLGAATLASCETPVRRAIPYVVKPDKIVPGVATFYASTFVNGGDFAPVLVKTREGRPIKLDGNKLSSVTKGGTDARAQASVLSLYDTARLRNPGIVNNDEVKAMTWEELDSAVKGQLNGSSRIRIVTKTLMSPITRQAVADFKEKYPNTEIVQYDPVSSSAILLANEACFGQRVIPSYHFNNADMVVSFGADFLGTWISPSEYSCQYTKGRMINLSDPKMSRHIQVEAGMTMTGSNADNRIMIRPTEQGAAIATLYNALAAKTGAPTVGAPQINEKAAAALRKVAGDLIDHRGHALVVSGSNNTGEQILVNKINDLIDSYGSTIDFGHVSYQRQGIDRDVRNLVREMNAGSIDALFVLNANPAFDLPDAEAFTNGMAKVKLRVSFNQTMDETTAQCTHIAPANHFLESWGDVHPKRGHYGLIQPTIARLFDTRQAESSFLVWSEAATYQPEAEQPIYEYLKAYWEANIFSQQTEFLTFQTFWDNALHDGLVEFPVDVQTPAFGGDVAAAAARITKVGSSDMEIGFYETINVGAGQYAGNPWLQELPDPVTRCVWGNYLQVPIHWDVDQNSFVGYNNIGSENAKGWADFVDLTGGEDQKRVTAIPQFGQMSGTVMMALGYGRTKGGKAAKGIGIDVFSWLNVDDDGNTQYFAENVALSESLGRDKYASVQYHHTMGVTGPDENGETINVDEKAIGPAGYQGSLTNRSIIFHSNIKDLKEFVHGVPGDPINVGLIEKRKEYNHLNDQTLYPYKEYTEKYYSQGHHWGLYIDMSACTGCGACVVACQAENNIPVVGKDEVHRHHEMSWLRIDRYYYGDAENPNVVYQPMMCQHCDNAPCENVCPVAATNHSGEGLNQMTYNRCIGTRYCANNCPYKVRRFNWLDYTSADLFSQNEVNLNKGIDGADPMVYMSDNLTRMVLNPDVTVRSRGVIEKCSFCVQNIQEAKLTAKREKRRLRDGDIRSACQTACPTGGIVFGDTNDPESAVSKMMKSQLGYRVLEEVNTQSSVVYAAKIDNRDEDLDAILNS